MPLENSVVVRQQEKPNHYNYLKSFRVDQCKEFLQHQCLNHKPYTCFKWHFPNQRRRKPVLNTKDGRFNYSPDLYCSKYDDANGSCPEGDSCPYLHRNLGDSERRYHLRHYKTESCSGEVDNHGNCSKNGLHCAFAHGPDDKRLPVLDITEQKAKSGSGSSQGGPDGSSVDDKNLVSVFDPVWYDESYLVTHYRTEMCQLATKHNLAQCPYYHNVKEKRRNSDIYKYRPVACPLVKDKDDWLEPSSCEKGDDCMYSHTRHELQYHPDIFRSQPCHKLQKLGSCNKGIFCPFAHLSSQSSVTKIKDVVNNDSVSSNNNNTSSYLGEDPDKQMTQLDYAANEDSDDSFLSIEPFPTSRSTHNISATLPDGEVVDASTSTTSLLLKSNGMGHQTVADRLQSNLQNLTNQSQQITSPDDINLSNKSKNGEIRLDALDDDFDVNKVEAPPPGFSKKSSQESFELMKLRLELSTLQKANNDLKMERDEAIRQKNQVASQLSTIKSEPAMDDSKFLRCLHSDLNISRINLATLVQIRSKLRRDMKIVDTAIEKLFYSSSSSSPPSCDVRCLVCNFYPCGIELQCGHKSLCNDCYITESFCPQCSSCILSPEL